MKVKELLLNKNFTLLTKNSDTEIQINDVYICDLLSWVMSHAGNQCAWITVQTHTNIVAVAVLLDMACIIIPEGIGVEESTLKKASEENLPILSTNLSTYEIASIIYESNKNVTK
ncbi:AraC family transcriptional regulator [Alkalibaculum sp. M08DMB]|uniref:AraC family transcriptional regulator n=1 Tax=Alkalibaculum sporogenes TaxID=2655001 RepID=A0A6A7K6J1_9FIRM|nr:DRTGG domain-containing protein [Alkalibaculum sporogenes]MPW24827.1 AraC family transcriptional regulator [Alkalibaculum sporogenes]